ncbi:Alpha/Beta hydrolase protein [Lophiotrema nucula]|uniref:Alpha/Beta hydrolase protein n=1 Tax=Lophiotrema nucula TaxID=690887 RepID=A0A6A5YQM5_9PLEO|nr:Alpha/Beta hydrolase protein [Lophiotrema nucula]
MDNLQERLGHYLRGPASRSSLYLFAGAACLGTYAIWRTISSNALESSPKSIPSPAKTVLPHLSRKETRRLPYPPDALPGVRDVESPYGSIRVYEWGREDGERVLFVHGISTPSLALGGVAHMLVERGYRVMLFDLFNRGYSSGPSPSTTNYDSALYTSQILTVLTSSHLPWASEPFILIGYSLGGAIAADFTSYFPHLIRGLVLIATGGLIRTNHISWKSRLLYSTSGLLPERFLERLVARRLWTGPETARSIEPEADTDPELKNEEDRKGGLRSSAVYSSSHRVLLPGNPDSTVGEVVDWQLQHHQGFVPAFISSIRHAPIHNQHHRWRVIGERMRKREGFLKHVDFVLGARDPIIIADELQEDAKEVLGEEFVRVDVVEGSGHEVPIERPDVVVKAVQRISADWETQ